MSKTDKSLSSQSWQASVWIIEDFLKSEEKLDSILDRRSRKLKSDVVRRIQYLSYGVVRNLGRLQALLKQATKKPPKKRLQAVMLVAFFEWISSEDEQRPKVVHFVVEQTKHLLSKPEARFSNAVLRKLPDLLKQEPAGDSIEDLSTLMSHPSWLVERWIEIFDESEVKQFLAWNQGTPKVYAFTPVSGEGVPEDWRPTSWNGFFEIQNADWSITRKWLSEGRVYIQDPSTRLGAETLDGLEIGSVLDLCAAPGGKSIQLLRRIKGDDGLLVSVDLPGVRFERMVENLARYERPDVNMVQLSQDVLQLSSSELPQPEFDLVSLDVPCSNSGVLQRRPDVKWRQSRESLRGLVRLQEALIKKSAEFVKLSGYLLYSTCSIDPDENHKIVDRFLENQSGDFVRVKEISSFPWETGHDGAGVYLLQRIK